VRDIQAHLLDIYEIDVSPDLNSKITDAVLDEVKEWQARLLEPVWPVIFLDAIVCNHLSTTMCRIRSRASRFVAAPGRAVRKKSGSPSVRGNRVSARVPHRAGQRPSA